MNLNYNDEFCRDTPVIQCLSLSDEHNVILDKYMRVNEAIKASPLNATPRSLLNHQDKLQLSEGVVQSLIYANQNLQLSASDLSAPIIGKWTFAALNLLIQEVGTSLDPSCPLDLIFPDKPVNSYTVMLDRLKGNSGVADPFFGDNNPITTVQQLDQYGISYKSALFANRIAITSQSLLFTRELGMSSFDQRGIGQLISYNMVNLTTMMFTRKKIMLYDMIFKNSYAWGQQIINSNIPAENFLPMQPMGVLNANGTVTYNTSDPFYNPVLQFTQILNNPIFIKYRRYVKGLLMNTADIMAVMNHPNIKTVTNFFLAGTSGENMQIKIGNISRDIAKYYAPSFDFPLIGDDSFYVGTGPDGQINNNDQRFLLPRGAIYILLDLTSINAQQGAMHLTYNQVDPNVEDPTCGIYSGVFSKNLTNSETTNTIYLVCSGAFAPGLYMSEAQFIITGMYSNVSLAIN